MELTPETFEKAEFVERRRGGYDIDQVEAFLEETGTEFARMLVKFQQADKKVAEALDRAAGLESEIEDLRRKLAESNDRAVRAEHAARVAEQESERAAAVAGESAAQAAASRSEEDVASVARALVLAQEASDAALKQAKAEAQSIIDDANSRAEQQLSETTRKVDALVNEARVRADSEYADRREAALAEVTDLEARRADLAEVISRMDERIEGYRNELRRAAQELVAIADDPNLMGSWVVQIDDGEFVEAVPEDVVPEDVVPEDRPVHSDPVPDVYAQPASDPEPGSGEVTQGALDLAPAEAEDLEPMGTDERSEETGPDVVEAVAQSDYLDIRPAPAPMTVDVEARVVEEDGDGEASSDEWGPGSWARIAESLPDEGEDSLSGHLEPERESVVAAATTSPRSTASGGRSIIDDVEDPRPTEAVDRVELIRDRYLEELDQAVNADLDPQDEALAAFLEGSSDNKARRFGWRR